MRTISTEAGYQLAAIGRRFDVKVEVKDAGGTWRDVASYPGFNALETASWGEDVDGPHATADVVLLAHAEKWSVSPLISAAAVNRGFNPAASYAAFLDLNRELRISVAVGGGDGPVGTYLVVFHGRIDTIDAGGERLQLACRSLSGALHDTWIEEERVYSFGTVSGNPVSMRVWAPSTAYSTSDYILPTEAKRNGRFYKCTTAGTSGTTEPTWPTSSTVADGTATHTYQSTTSTAGNLVEKVMQNILDDNGFSSVVLYTPTPSTWAIKQFLQKREPVFDALTNLAMQIGWQVRYKWRSGTGQFELTFSQPDRAKSAVDRVFAASDYAGIPRLALDLSSIRTTVRVRYPNAASLDPAGNPTRAVVTRTDSTAETKYGRRFMEISEADSSQIDSSTEATAMADAALADLKDPKVEQSVDLLGGFPFVELGDLYRFTANGYHYDADQELAVFGYRHEANGAGVMSTRLDCRGKPSGAFSGWFARSVLANPEEETPVNVFASGAGLVLAASAIIGGCRLTCTPSPERSSDGGTYEFHVSTSSGFTPSSSTLKTVGRSREVEVTDLVPGTTYYAKVVPSYPDTNGRIVRGYPSEQVSVVAGRGATAHLIAEPEWGRYPLNGGFETRHDASGPPDHWTVATGTWGTDFDIVSGSGGRSGDKYLRIVTTNAAVLRSSEFVCEEGARYALSFLSKNSHATTAGGTVKVRWLRHDRVTLSTSGLTIPGGTSWVKSVMGFTAPADTRFAQIEVTNESFEEESWVDQIRFEQLGKSYEAWNVPSLQNSWSDVGSGHQPSGYRKDIGGRVHLRGLIKGGTTTDNTLLFVLDAGYRPPAEEYRMTMCSTSAGARAIVLLLIQADGDVRIYDMPSSSYNDWLTLSGVSFDTN